MINYPDGIQTLKRFLPISSVLFLFCFSAALHSQELPGAVKRPPSISQVWSEKLSGRQNFGNDPVRLMRFTITNHDTVAFILGLEFDNGGELTHIPRQGGKRGNHDRNKPIPVRDLKLRYKNETGAIIEKNIAHGRLKAGGFAGEAEFAGKNDIQQYYEMELWGELHEDDRKNLFAGTYTETVRIKVTRLIEAGSGQN